jgi:hypothetical protein
MEFSRAYTNDFLVASKDSFQNHVKYFDEVFIPLSIILIKVDASKAHVSRELEYLGYQLKKSKTNHEESGMYKQHSHTKHKKLFSRFIGMVNH